MDNHTPNCSDDKILTMVNFFAMHTCPFSMDKTRPNSMFMKLQHDLCVAECPKVQLLLLAIPHKHILLVLQI